MTKSELRKARQKARAEGRPLIGELALKLPVHTDDRVIFSRPIRKTKMTPEEKFSRLVYDLDRPMTSDDY